VDRVPLDQMEQEWRHEILGDRVAARFAYWRGQHRPLRAFGSPVGIVRFLHGEGDPARKDEVLEAVLREASGDEVAARFVLHAILPGLKHRAGRMLIDSRDREELWSALLAIAWQRIRSYPQAGGPRRVAATLVLNVVRDSVRELRRRREEAGELISPEATAIAATGAPSPDNDVEALVEEGVAAGAISESEAELVLATRIDGRPLATLAEETGVAYNTMKVRRQRAERRLLLWLGYPPVPRGQQRRPSLAARVVGAGPSGQAGGSD
jgi:DNA-directed RNA polymerase specialized sigma24 family protein